jgi:hypothetical protein
MNMGYFTSARRYCNLEGEKFGGELMSRGHEQEITKITKPFASHIPIPYGCLTLLALILGALTTVVLSSLAIGIAILH